MPQCLKLMLKHATQIKECKKGSLEGDRCTVQCNRGFTPVAPFEIICSNREWQVDGAVPKCTPVDCGTLKIKNAEICKYYLYNMYSTVYISLIFRADHFNEVSGFIINSNFY